MPVLPDPPSSLPPEPRAFYEAVRNADAPAALEVDFGDGGIGLSFPGGIGAQCSRRAAIVFADNDVEHFDERTPGWIDAAATALLGALVNRP